MRLFFSKLFARLKSNAEIAGSPVQSLDYDEWIPLDAEDLAEQGMAYAYQKLMPELLKYIADPAPLTQIVDNEVPSYKVECGGQEYLIYSAEEPDTESESWGRATYFFFLIVNRQLVDSGVKLYAINNGNDLGAFFLTEEQAAAAQRELPRKTDWPYIPTLGDEWYGQFH